MVKDLTFNSKLLLMGGFIIGSVSLGILGYAAVRYTFLSTLLPILYLQYVKVK